MKSLRLQERWPSLIAFILICLAVFIFGGLFRPGDWYLALNRAPWSPPNIAFPIVWTFLYAFIAIVGWQIYHLGNSSLRALWITQLILNGLWSWVFFGQHWVVAALLNIVVLDILVINLALKARRAGMKITCLLLTPYIAWLLLATSLNMYIVLAN